MKINFTEDDVKKLFTSDKLDLMPTQAKVCLPIINRMCQRMGSGAVLKNIHVDNGVIVNGHHRYISSKLIDNEIGVDPWTKASSVEVIAWSNLDIDNIDWTTKEDLEKYNEQDSKALNVTIEQLLEWNVI